jgi:T-complex protein 1 subunit beta
MKASLMLDSVCSLLFIKLIFLISRPFLDMEQGTIGSMKKMGVTESYKLKRQVVLSASEAAEMIIRCVFVFKPPAKSNKSLFSVDDILRAAPRRREAV